MRRAEGRLIHRAAAQRAGERVDGGNLDRFVVGKRRQERYGDARKHCFAGAGRAEERDVVSSCCRYLEPAFCCFLSANIRERYTFESSLRAFIRTGMRLEQKVITLVEMRDDVGECPRGIYENAGDERGFIGILLRHEKLAEPFVPRHDRN